MYKAVANMYSGITIIFNFFYYFFMARANSTKLSAGSNAVLNRICVAESETILGANAITAIGEMVNRNGEVGTWNVGDEFVIPAKEVLEDSLFVQPVGAPDADGNRSKAAGIAVDLINGASKVLYLSTLKKSAMEYNDKWQPTVAHQSSTDFAKTCLGCATLGEVFQVLENNAGKKVRVTNVDRFKTARFKYENGVPVVCGLRNTSVPHFELS